MEEGKYQPMSETISETLWKGDGAGSDSDNSSGEDSDLASPYRLRPRLEMCRMKGGPNFEFDFQIPDDLLECNGKIRQVCFVIKTPSATLEENAQTSTTDTITRLYLERSILENAPGVFSAFFTQSTFTESTLENGGIVPMVSPILELDCPAKPLAFILMILRDPLCILKVCSERTKTESLFHSTFLQQVLEIIHKYEFLTVAAILDMFFASEPYISIRRNQGAIFRLLQDNRMYRLINSRAAQLWSLMNSRVCMPNLHPQPETIVRLEDCDKSTLMILVEYAMKKRMK